MTLATPGGAQGGGLGLWGAPGFADFRDWSFAGAGAAGAASSGGSAASAFAGGPGSGGGGASAGGATTAGSSPPAEPAGLLLHSDEPGTSEEPDTLLGLGGAASLDLRDLLTSSLLDEVVGLSLNGGPDAAGAGAGAPAAQPAAAAPAPAPRLRRRAHDPDATEFLFHLVTSVHEEAYERARGEGGAGYRRQIAAEAVEAIEALGADVRGCDAETEDGAPLTLLTLLFRCAFGVGGLRRARGRHARVRRGGCAWRLTLSRLPSRCRRCPLSRAPCDAPGTMTGAAAAPRSSPRPRAPAPTRARLARSPSPRPRRRRRRPAAGGAGSTRRRRRPPASACVCS
jgi:hypothetical protein